MKFEKGDILHSKDDLNPIGWIIILDGYYPAFKYSVMLNRDQKLVYNNTCVSDGFTLANEEQKQILFDALAKENKYYCEKTKTIKEMNKEFTKKDLKSGMWIECRNGYRYLLMHNKKDGELWGFRFEGMMRTEDFNEDLTFMSNKWDIIKIWHYDNPMNTNEVDFGSEYLIWQRNDKDQIKSKIDEIQRIVDDMQEDIKQKLESINKLKEELK